MAKKIKIIARTNKIGSECSKIIDFMDDEEYEELLEEGLDEIDNYATEFLMDNLWRVADIGYEIIDDA